MITRRVLAGGAGALLLPLAARADLAPPRGKTLLTLNGRITRGKAGATAQFDHDMLDALPQGRFFGSTPWTRGDTVFTGPLLSAVLDAAGAEGDTLEIAALNDYFAIVPVSDVRLYPVILASRRNGQAMTVRDKGPLWVIYPMDTNASLRNEAIYARSVWQVSRITVR